MRIDRSVTRPLGLVGRAGTLRTMAKDVVRLGGVPSDVDELRDSPAWADTQPTPHSSSRSASAHRSSTE